MERESNSMQALCRSGCGFYGNPATDGLCSICYKEALKKKQQPPSTSPSSAYTHSSHSTDTGMPTIPSLISSSILPTTCSAAASVSSAMSTSAQNSAAAANSSSMVDGADSLLAKESEESAAGPSPSAEASTSSDDKQDDKDDGKSKKKNRCGMCRKKVGLTGFECRCGGLFCAIHRYSDKHDCSFDYRELGAQEIRRNNPVVVGEKIQKI